MKQRKTWKIEELVTATGGTLVKGTGSGSFTGISTDSRKILISEVFLALHGENFDGHTFIPQVIEQGIQCIILSRRETIQKAEYEINVILVDDTLKALGSLAAYLRNQNQVSVAAITGSNGKTTTKEILFSIFSKKYNTLHTKGNLNNEIGLPLTLLNLSNEHQWAVLELGMNQKGEINRLSKICRPDIGIITNVGKAHIEFFGSMEKIADAKGEMLPNIRKNGIAILNYDNPMYNQLKNLSKSNILSFGLSENADVRATDVNAHHFSTTFNLIYEKSSRQITVNQPGAFMVYNCLAAASAAFAAGIEIDTISRGISDFSTISGRMNITEFEDEIVLIDDTYNASPDSMAEAVQMLTSLDNPGRKILISGDMLELGKESDELHFKTGKQAAESGLDLILATGKQSVQFTEGAISGGLNKDSVYTGTKNEIVQTLKAIIKRKDTLLIKGSRGIKMEEIAEPLTQFLEKRQN